MNCFGAIIVDDEPLARLNIASLLKRDPEILILAQCGSCDEAVEAVRKLKPTLLFLDIQMPGRNGFDVLEELSVDVPAAVIFVTAYDQYAVKAFEAEALDYLLKPFDDARFLRVLSRAKAALAGQVIERPGRRLVIRNSGRITFLPVDEIDWIEAADYYSCLHVGSKTYMLRRSMAELERDLEPALFCRAHRSTIVNLARVRDLASGSDAECEVVLHDQTRLKVSRSYRDKLLSSLLQSNRK